MIRQIFEKHPLPVALLSAFIIRSVAAICNYGPLAHDDFINVIEPALRFLFLGTSPEVPDLRFKFLPYSFAYLMYPLYALGVRRVDLLVSSGYFLLGMISLTQIVAAHRIGTLLFSERTRNAFTLFAATWAIAPIFTNSVDIAAPAYILMTFAILHMIMAFPEQFGLNASVTGSSRTRHLFLTGFYLSAAVLFRFSLAPLFAGLAAWAVYAEYRRQRVTESLLYLSLGGLLTTIIMIILEIGSGRKPLSTVIAFVLENVQMHISTQSYGTMPWYTYLGITLLFPIPVLSFLFWPFMIIEAKRFSGLAVLYVTFLVSHSLIAFKLDRYLIPMVPILIILFFATIERYSERKFIRYSYRLVLIINALMIAPVTMTMQQRAGVDGAIFAGSLEGPLFVSKIDPWRHSYFGLQTRSPVFAESAAEIATHATKQKYSEFHVYRFLYFSDTDLAVFAQSGYECQLSRVFKPDLLERLAILLNPAMNGRRDDTSIYRCMRKQA